MTPNKKIYNHSFLGGLGKLKFFDEDGNLLCHKTQTYMEAGFIFAPYIPRVEDSSEFRPKRSLRGRYAQRIVDNSFYGIIEHDETE
jgi:hypothetical protein